MLHAFKSFKPVGSVGFVDCVASPRKQTKRCGVKSRVLIVKAAWLKAMIGPEHIRNADFASVLPANFVVKGPSKETLLPLSFQR
jgi:hypothetical protein